MSKSPFPSELASTAGITLQQPDNGWVALGTFDEFFQGQFAIIVCVHLPEDLVCSLLGRGLVLRHLHHGGHHLVDGLQRGICECALEDGG